MRLTISPTPQAMVKVEGITADLASVRTEVRFSLLSALVTVRALA